MVGVAGICPELEPKISKMGGSGKSASNSNSSQGITGSNPITTKYTGFGSVVDPE